MSPLLLVLVVLSPTLLAGCISAPETALTVRRGDLIQAAIGVWDDGELVFPPEAEPPPGCVDPPSDPACQPPAGAYAVAQQVPARMPAGWGNATALPPGVVEALSGMTEDQTRHAEAIKAWGNRSEDLVERHPRTTELTRFVESAEVYGRTWETTTLDNGTLRIDPGPDDRGQPVEVTRWCNQRFCLFTSALIDWNATHLTVRHQADPGDQVHVTSLDTWLEVTEVTEDQVTVDGNHPRAGGTFDVTVRVEEIRTPPEGQRRAPSFTVTTLNGTEVSLADQAGQPLILEFFASWCPSCAKNTDHLSQLQTTYGSQITILAIDVDPWEKRAELRAFIEDNDVTWPIALDRSGEVSRAYGVGSLSTEVIVSPEGAIVHTETGVADHERVSRIVHDLLPPDHHDGGAEADHP